MYTKVNHINSAKVWFFLGTITLPLALVILFEVLKGRQVIIGAWVWSVMAPLEQVLGRLWSLFPVSVAEVFAVLFLSGCTVWLGRAIVLVVHQKKPILFLRRLGFVPNVIFPCAALTDKDTGRVAVYYGAADSYVGLAFTYMDEIVDYIKNNSVVTSADTEIGIR